MATSLGAYTETGIVTDHRDLLLKLKIFAESLGWTTLRYNTVEEHELVLKTPDNKFFLGFKEFNNIANDAYNIQLQNYTTFSASRSFHDQNGAIPYKGYNNYTANFYGANQLTLSNQTMQYWFNLFENKVLIVCKIGSVYVSSYSGKFKAYASPLQYPKPCFIGGNSSGGKSSSVEPIERYSIVSSQNTNFIFGICSTTQVTTNAKCRNYITLPDNSYLEVASNSLTPSSNSDNYAVYDSNLTNNCYIYGFGFAKENAISLFESLSNEKEIKVATLISSRSLSDKETLGEFFSCALITGTGLTPEDTVISEGSSYIIFPDVYRSNSYDFWVFKIE